MYRLRPRRAPADRRGVILLVVVTLLTLFAVVGLTFVLYAESAATSSRYYREQDNDYYHYLQKQPQPFNFALGQAIYDVSDNEPDSNSGDDAGVYSALRGHSLARSIFGYNDGMLNTTPFDGTGRLGGPNSGPNNQDERDLVNYTWYREYDGFVRDPERLPNPAGMRANPQAAKTPFVGGFNVPYTYPDSNNLFLAAVRADGTVMIPSFHRMSGPGGNGAGSLDPSGATWQRTPAPPQVQSLKHMTLRPLPALHEGFPAPVDAGGDVQNLERDVPAGQPRMDSIWVDLGHPVRQLPDGRRYKPMFAFLIRDLDNLINVNLHGNSLIAGGGHASNQGWGPWEINPAHLSGNAAAWQQLLLGGNQPRYGIDGQPGPGAGPPLVGAPQIMAKPRDYVGFDFDAAQNGMGGRAPSDRFNATPPGGTTFSSFPTAANGYDSAIGSERVNHPAAFNPFSPGAANAGDNVFDPHRFDKIELKKLMYALGSRNTQATSSDLGKALSSYVGNPRLRNMLTTLSADLDRPGVSPYIWDPNDPNTTLKMNPFDPTDPQTWGPSGMPLSLQSLGSRNNPVPTHSEYTADWRSNLATAGRINLNVKFTNFNDNGQVPHDAEGMITDPAIYFNAHAERQRLAKDIFDRLRKVTGAADFPPGGPGNADPPEYQANRWLAQLAVNIVDYIDPDDFSTIFVWNPIDPSNPNAPANFAPAEVRNRVVYGTELPRLVLNEVYAQLENNPDDDTIKNETDDDKKKASTYHYNVWVELHNTHKTEPDQTIDYDQGRAVLMRGTVPVYKLVVSATSAKLRDRNNVKGDPEPFPDPLDVMGIPDVNSVVKDFGAVKYVAPSNGKFKNTDAVNKNDGFYVIGPKTTPKLPTTVESKDMRLQLKVAADNTDKPTLLPTVLLRKLACEAMPANDYDTTTNALQDPNLPYNPYITIDYVTDIPWGTKYSDDDGDHLKYDGAGPAQGAWANVKEVAHGRKQPYAADKSQIVATSAANGDYHTFFRHNSSMDDPNQSAPLQRPFDWLLQLNRPIQNPIELLHVSSFKPHELLQQFVYNGKRFQHEAPWIAPVNGVNMGNPRIHRFLELVQTRDHVTGGGPGGRVLGKLNINTIWEKEIFDALADASSSNTFNQADVDEVWGHLVGTRTPQLGTNQITVNDRPLKGLAIGLDGADPQHTGIEASIFRHQPPTAPMFMPSSKAADHPYIKHELLRKIYNNITTRSNVFAVWCTVGYFEVTNDTTRPVKLGAEIGSDKNRVFRSQFFAIVDRTMLSIDPTNPTKQGDAPIVIASLGAVGAGMDQNIPVASVSGVSEEVDWAIVPGATVILDPGTIHQESVTVKSVGGNSFTADTTHPHDAGCGIAVPRQGKTQPAIPGNPGPQGKWFDLNSEPYKGTVVRFFERLK